MRTLRGPRRPRPGPSRFGVERSAGCLSLPWPIFACAHVGRLSIALPRRARWFARSWTVAAGMGRSRCRSALRQGPALRIARRHRAVARHSRPSAGMFRLTAIELRTRVAMIAAGPPVAAAFFLCVTRVAVRPLRLLRVVPQTAACEPFHHDVGVGAFQLSERRLQLLALRRTEGGRLVVDEDCPVRKTRRHGVIVLLRKDGYGCSRLSFSTSVVRFRLSSFAAAPLLPPVRSSDR
jgi:hypothetical protein